MIKKLFQKAKKLDKRIKFLFVGCLNTAVGVGVEILVYCLCGLPFSFSNNLNAALWMIILASAVSQIVGTIHSYFWNKFFTFESKSKSVSEFFRFIAVYAVTFAVSIGLKYLLNNVAKINVYISMIISLFVTTVISYLGHNFFSFKKGKTEPEITDAATEEKTTAPVSDDSPDGGKYNNGDKI